MVVTRENIARVLHDPELLLIYLKRKVRKLKNLRTPHCDLPVTIILDIPKISGNTITFQWKCSSSIPLIRKNSWSLTYPGIDCSTIPRELVWMIYALMTSEIFAQASLLTITLPEALDEQFLKWWKGVLKINHAANPYNENLAAESEFTIINGKREITPNPFKPAAHFSQVCMNSMGKDALSQIALVRELTQEPLLAVTVDNSWLFRKKSMFNRVAALSKSLKKYEIHPYVVSSPVKDSFDFRIIPWQIFSLPLLYTHHVETCYWALELPFNKCCNSIPVKPNATVILLESINKVLKDLGYTFTFKSGVVPLTTFGTMKLFIDRYPEFSCYHYSCMHQYPPCSRCQKCQSQMAYITVCGKDYREWGYKDIEIKELSAVSDVLDIEREPIEHAINMVQGIPDDLEWVEKYYKDAIPYAIPGVESILKEHFEGFEGPFTSYGMYTYNPRQWDDIAAAIYPGEDNEPEPH